MLWGFLYTLLGDEKGERYLVQESVCVRRRVPGFRSKDFRGLGLNLRVWGLGV